GYPKTFGCSTLEHVTRLLMILTLSPPTFQTRHGGQSAPPPHPGQLSQALQQAPSMYRPSCTTACGHTKPWPMTIAQMTCGVYWPTSFKAKPTTFLKPWWTRLQIVSVQP